MLRAGGCSGLFVVPSQECPYFGVLISTLVEPTAAQRALIGEAGLVSNPPRCLVLGMNPTL